MATAEHDRVLTLPNVPLRVQNIWGERVSEIGIERVQRAFEARNPYPLETFSWFQRRVNEALQFCRVPYDSHPFMLPLFDERTGDFFTFRPDYKLRTIKINGKDTLLEPHTVYYLDEARVRKFELFDELYGDEYQLIWITDSSPFMLSKKLSELGRTSVIPRHETVYLMDDPPDDGEHHAKYINMKSPSKDTIRRLRGFIYDLQRRGSESVRQIAPQN